MKKKRETMRRAEADVIGVKGICKTFRRKETKIAGKEIRTDELFD
jgi:hypothetical protein